jgi:hypothetical protein
LQLLVFGDAGIMCRLSLGWSRTVGALGFGPVAASSVELFQQFAHAAYRSGASPIPRQLPPPPMMILPVGVEHALDVTVLHLHPVR